MEAMPLEAMAEMDASMMEMMPPDVASAMPEGYQAIDPSTGNAPLPGEGSGWGDGAGDGDLDGLEIAPPMDGDMPPPGGDPMGLAMDDGPMDGDGIPGMAAPSAPMDAAIAAIDEVAAEVIADEAPDLPETGPDGDPGMVDEQPQDDPSDIA